jgi:hypothetical protein
MSPPVLAPVPDQYVTDVRRNGRHGDHIVVVHRWRDRYALYDGYIDHVAHTVSYVTTSLGAESVPAQAAAVVVVPATDEPGAVRGAVDELGAQLGRPDYVVALNEGDLDTAAVVREQFGCPGLRPVELDRFRDKLTMVSAVAAAGIPVPAFADAPDVEAVSAFAAAHGWPIVVKPRRGTASRDVVVLGSPADLARLDLADEPHLVQVYVSDSIFHIDGLWTGTELGPWRASRYVNTCKDFNDGMYLASIEIDDPALLPHLERFTAAAAGALSSEPWIFHMEAFVGAAADDVPRLTFLEAGARVGGGEIPFVWREVHGVDLMSVAVDIQLGKELDVGAPRNGETAGFLLVPVPVERPCRVVEASLDVAGKGPYAQAVPQPGTTIPALGGYEHIGARFRFRGRSSHDVEAAIRRTIAGFRLACEAVPQ